MSATLTEFANANQGFSLIPNRKLLALHAAMLSCRKKSESTARGKAGKRPGTGEAVVGNEAALVGATIDLLSGDTVAPALWPQDFVAAFNSSVRLHGDVREAVHSAAANGAGGVTVAFDSGGKKSQTRWRKCMEFAAGKKLPILFVSLSESDPGKALLKARDFASGMGVGSEENALRVPRIVVDRNDVVAFHRVTSEAMVHARKGHGPTLIECGASTSADALENMRKYLIRKGLNGDEIQNLDGYH
jgi:TPP-dependent pyruvate/acetoin dehydrogenase alpha subunit